MKTIINYLLTFLLWIAAIIIWAALSFPFLFFFLFGLHFIELLVIGFRSGKEYGVSPIKSILMCMLFGFNWWLPLRKQMKRETFTDLDFVREG